MEVKSLIVALVASVALSGCSLFSPKIKTDVQKVLIPVVSIPMPPEMERPELPIDNMSQEQIDSDGEVVKHYKATVKVLQNYINELELVIENYRVQSKNAEVIRKEVEESIKKSNTASAPSR